MFYSFRKGQSDWAVVGGQPIGFSTRSSASINYNS